MQLPIVALIAFQAQVVSPEHTLVEDQLIAEANQVRESHGLGPLRVHSALTSAARWHAKDMADGGYLNHRDREGRMPWDRANDFSYPQYRVVRENLAQTYELQAEVPVKLWLESKGHRENLLAKDVDEVGVGIRRGEGRKIYWAMILARRSR